MPYFSDASAAKLAECVPELQLVFKEVIKHFDCTIVTGHRGAEEQNRLFGEGKTQVQYPNSKHNTHPSLAVDVVPYPIDWRDRERMFLLAGFALGIGKQFGVDLRWGGDWDRDTQVKDNNFDDLIHFEVEHAG